MGERIPLCALFDSWYAAASLLYLLESLGWKYVARLKSNCLFEGKAVRERWPHRFGRAIGRVRKVNHEVVVVKDGRRYFVSNEMELSSTQLKRHYRFRQQIEEVFRLLKQEFGWGGASAQKASAQRAHLHLGLYALCLTQQAAIKNRQMIYAFKRRLFRLPIAEHLSQLENLSLAA
jgi:transposase